MDVEKIWSSHSDDYEECRLLAYKPPVRTSQETYYDSATEPNQLMLCKIWGFHGCDYEECRLLVYKNPVRTSQETHHFSAIESSWLMLCTIWVFRCGDYEERHLLGYKTPVRTSQETHYVSITEPNQLMLYKIWGFHGSDYEECRLLVYKNPVRTSQETHHVSAIESSRLMLCKIWVLHDGDYEECRLLGCDAVWLLTTDVSGERIAPSLGRQESTILRNVSSCTSHTASHPRERHSSLHNRFNKCLPQKEATHWGIWPNYSYALKRSSRDKGHVLSRAGTVELCLHSTYASTVYRVCLYLHVSYLVIQLSAPPASYVACQSVTRCYERPLVRERTIPTDRPPLVREI
jgi:hypothetical protein